MSNIANTIAGTGPLDLLTIAFVILKLCKVIDWSWWWVFSPIWIPLAIIVVIGILAAIINGLSR